MSRIKIVVSHGADGLIHCLSSSGHAARRGRDSLPCGVVSNTLRAFGRVLADRGDLSIKARISWPGHFEIKIGSLPAGIVEWYRGVCTVLEQMLRDAQTDFPDQISMELQIIEQEI